MRFTNCRSARVGMLALALGTLTFGCSSDATLTAPRATLPSAMAPHGSILGTVGSLVGLIKPVADLLQLLPIAQRLLPLHQNVSLTRTVGPAGGTIDFPQGGIRVVFPQGAVAAPTAFTVTALAGDAFAYDFQPHRVFPVGVELRIDISRSSLPSSNLFGGYMPDEGSGLDKSGYAQVSELYPASVDSGSRTARVIVPHFTGYVLVGRR